MGLKYEPSASVTKTSATAPSVAVGSFVDSRGEPANWLGAIRGGFGNPLKNLESGLPVATLVQAAFADGLRARGILPGSKGQQFQISGVIRKLDCNQYVRREANVEIEVLVTDAQDGHQRFTRAYSSSNVEGSALALNVGVFASVDDLRAVTERTLREVVDKALDDTALRAALKM